MKALITGASSGIGYELAKNLSNRGYDLIVVARDGTRLNNLKNILSTDVRVICMDLSDTNNCIELHNLLQNEKIDLLFNNAGFGLFGKFCDLSLERELNMIDLNIKSIHILTKLFLNDMIKNGKGKILNVASIAGFMPGGPLMATYYATKSYVLSLTSSINKELKKDKVNVTVAALCPGPVNTNFNNVADVNFNIKPLSADYVASYAIEKLLNNKKVIIPGIISKFIFIASKIVPNGILLECAYKAQTKKIKK